MRLPRSWAADGWIDPFPAAQAAIWAREVKPSLDRIFATWRAAVAGLMTSSSAMPLLLCPWAMSAVISRSRGVSEGGGASDDGGASEDGASEGGASEGGGQRRRRGLRRGRGEPVVTLVAAPGAVRGGLRAGTQGQGHRGVGGQAQALLPQLSQGLLAEAAGRVQVLLGPLGGRRGQASRLPQGGGRRGQQDRQAGLPR